MQELEKILEEIQGKAIELKNKHWGDDGWIPVEEELPPFGKRLQATILHHEWIADYDSSWVPEEDKVYHPAYTEVCEIYPIGALWGYACEEDDYHSDIAYVEPLKDISRPIAEIIAWRPLPAPYNPEKTENNQQTDWRERFMKRFERVE